MSIRNAQVLVKMMRSVPTRQERHAPAWKVVKAISFALLGVGFVGFLFVTPRRMCTGYSMSKNEIASLTAKKFATEAYPLWQVAHPGRVCPESLDELNEWADSKDGKDPWGQPYQYRCTATRFVVWSMGEDWRDGTADDIDSRDQ